MSIIFYISLAVNVFSQTPENGLMSDYDAVNNLSYKLFAEKNWTELDALQDKIDFKNCDFLNLRLRLGIAFYEQQQYYNAVKQFNLALKFDDRNSTALEYLYFAYLYTGQDAEAIAVSNKFSSATKERLKIKSNKIISASMSGGAAFSNNQKLNGKIDIDGADNLFGEIDKNKNMYLGSVTLNTKLFSKCLLTTSYNYLMVDKSKEIRYYYHVPPPNLGHQPTQQEAANSIKHVTNTSNYKVTQNEFHLGAQMVLNKGWKIFPAVHIVNYGYSSFTTTYNQSRDNYILSETSVSATNFVTALQVSKNLKKVNIGLGQSYSNFYTKTQLQTDLLFTYFPAKSKDVIAITNLTYFNESGTNRVLLHQKVGSSFGKRAYAEGNLTLGNLQDVQQANGFIVYNIADATNFKLGTQFTYALSSKLILSANYDYISRLGYYTTRTKSVQEKYVTTKYQYNSIIIGLKWKF